MLPRQVHTLLAASQSFHQAWAQPWFAGPGNLWALCGCTLEVPLLGGILSTLKTAFPTLSPFPNPLREVWVVYECLFNHRHFQSGVTRGHRQGKLKNLCNIPSAQVLRQPVRAFVFLVSIVGSHSGACCSSSVVDIKGQPRGSGLVAAGWSVTLPPPTPHPWGLDLGSFPVL